MVPALSGAVPSQKPDKSPHADSMRREAQRLCNRLEEFSSTAQHRKEEYILEVSEQRYAFFRRAQPARHEVAYHLPSSLRLSRMNSKKAKPLLIYATGAMTPATLKLEAGGRRCVIGMGSSGRATLKCD